jgi:hypothetical protein
VLSALSWLQEQRPGQPAAAAAARLSGLITKVEAHMLGGSSGGGAHAGGGPCGVEHFRLHPKGQGVFCMRKGGLPARTLVAEYIGELYPPWRWFEKQASALAGAAAQRRCAPRVAGPRGRLRAASV